MEICCGWSHNSVWAPRTMIFPAGAQNLALSAQNPSRSYRCAHLSKNRFFVTRCVIQTAGSFQSIPNHTSNISTWIMTEKVGSASSLECPAYKNWKFWRIWTLANIHDIPYNCAQSFEKTDFGSQEPYWSPEIAPEHFKQQYYHVLTHCDAKIRLGWCYLSPGVQNEVFRRIVHIWEDLMQISRRWWPSRFSCFWAAALKWDHSKRIFSLQSVRTW